MTLLLAVKVLVAKWDAIFHLLNKRRSLKRYRNFRRLMTRSKQLEMLNSIIPLQQT